MEKTVKCKVCSKIINSGEERFICSECGYQSICKDCHPKTIMDKFAHPDSAPLPHFSTVEIYSQYELNQDLFKLKNDLSEFTLKSFRSFSERRCLGYLSPESNLDKEDEIKIQWLSYKEVMERAMKIGTYLYKNLPLASRVGIYLPNTPEWYFSDLATIWYGMTTVPYHYQLNKDSLLALLKDSDISAIFVNHLSFKNLVNLIGPGSEQLGFDFQLTNIIYIGYDCDLEMKNKLPSNICFSYMSDLLLMDNSSVIEPVGSAGGERKISSISFSSGTTGDPKGVVNLDYQVSNFFIVSNPKYTRIDVSHAPLGHIQRKIDLCTLSFGGRVALFSYDFKHLFSYVRAVRPSSFGGVPRIYSMIYANYQVALQSYIDSNRSLSKEQCQIDVKSCFKDILGDRLKTLSYYGANITEYIGSFLKEVWGDILKDNYGTTESMSIASNGIVFKEVDYCLIPIPELGFSPNDKPFPRGELLVKSQMIFEEYYKNPEITNISKKDGWYITGDIVEEYEPRRIRVVDRKKHSFKLNNGEFVCAEAIERIFSTSPLIKNIFVYGNSSKSFLVAVVIPSEKAIQLLNSKSLKIPIKDNNHLKRIIMEEIDKRSQLNKSANYEIPKMILLDDTEWKMENKMITLSGKLSRPKIYEYYKSMIEHMYETLDSIQFGLVSESKDKYETIYKYMFNVLGLDINMDSKLDISKISFSQIGGDSVAAVKLANILKEKIQVDIKPQQILDKNIKLDEIFKNALSTKKINWDEEMKLDESIQVGTKPIKVNNFANIFLTGATGFNGSHLLYGLVKEVSCSKVFCLIRGISSVESAKKKLVDIIRLTYNLILNENEIEKIYPVIGDLELPLLGMSEAEFIKISNEIDIIIHNGAYVHLINPYSNMKDVNVKGTEEVLRLATIGNQIIPVSHISTIGTFHSFDLVIDDTKDPDLNNLDEMSGYAQSKLIAEQLIHKAFERGVPAIISRPGIIYSHTETGVDNSNDLIRLVISGIMNLGYYPDLSENSSHLLNLSPVDWVTSSIIKYSLNRDWTSKTDKTPTILLTNQNSIDFDEFFESVNKVNPIKKISFTKWSESIMSQPNNPLQSIFAGFNGIIPTVSKYNIENHNTIKKIIECGGYSCPVINDKIIHRNINYLNKNY